MATKKKESTLKVKAEHFKGNYGSNTNCPIARAAKEQFKTHLVAEFVDCIRIAGKWYKHDYYSSQHYSIDKDIAQMSKSNKIIQEFKLIPIPKRLR